MNTRERFVRALTGQEVDRVPFIKVFGGTNTVMPAWEKEFPGISKCIDKILGFEGEYRGWQITPINMGFCGIDKTIVIEETDTKVIQKKGDGTVEMIYKGDKNSFSHIIEWPVKACKDWSRLKEQYLRPEDPGRFPENWKDYVNEYRRRDYPLQLTHGGVYGFARTVLGDENLAYAFYDEPEMVHDIMNTYTDMCIAIWEKMTCDVEFDLIECWEDMAYNGGVLISPDIFREFIKPNYIKIADFAREHDIKIILVDSDGNIEKLTELMLESGVTAMYPYEVQAGNDAGKMIDKYPILSIIGGLDKNVMDRGKDAIDLEMEKARRLIKKGRFIPGPDHFPVNASWDSYRYFMERLREVVMSTTVSL